MNRYPSDEELSAWIEQLEQEELYAPKHLKQQILERWAVSSDVASKKRSGHQAVQMFTYSVKVIAGMAAAILMLILLPVQESHAEGIDTIALKEQRQAEAIKEREDDRVKALQNKERYEVFLQKSKETAEKKLADVVNHIENLWE